MTAIHGCFKLQLQFSTCEFTVESVHCFFFYLQWNSFRGEEIMFMCFGRSSPMPQWFYQLLDNRENLHWTCNHVKKFFSIPWFSPFFSGKSCTASTPAMAFITVEGHRSSSWLAIITKIWKRRRVPFFFSPWREVECPETCFHLRFIFYHSTVRPQHLQLWKVSQSYWLLWWGFCKDELDLSQI